MNNNNREANQHILKQQYIEYQCKTEPSVYYNNDFLSDKSSSSHDSIQEEESLRSFMIIKDNDDFDINSSTSQYKSDIYKKLSISFYAKKTNNTNRLLNGISNVGAQDFSKNNDNNSHEIQNTQPNYVSHISDAKNKNVIEDKKKSKIISNRNFLSMKYKVDNKLNSEIHIPFTQNKKSTSSIDKTRLLYHQKNSAHKNIDNLQVKLPKTQTAIKTKNKVFFADSQINSGTQYFKSNTVPDEATQPPFSTECNNEEFTSGITFKHQNFFVNSDNQTKPTSEAFYSKENASNLEVKHTNYSMLTHKKAILKSNYNQQFELPLKQDDINNSNQQVKELISIYSSTDESTRCDNQSSSIICNDSETQKKSAFAFRSKFLIRNKINSPDNLKKLNQVNHQIQLQSEKNQISVPPSRKISSPRPTFYRNEQKVIEKPLEIANHYQDLLIYTIEHNSPKQKVNTPNEKSSKINIPYFLSPRNSIISKGMQIKMPLNKDLPYPQNIKSDKLNNNCKQVINPRIIFDKIHSQVNGIEKFESPTAKVQKQLFFKT